MTGKRRRYFFCFLHILFTAGAFFYVTGHPARIPLAFAAEDSRGPLIQATTFQEEYEGMVSLDGLRTPVLEEADADRAFANVQAGIVQIFAGSYYGSGVIWKMDEEKLILISNRHLLSGWNEKSRVVFSGGASAGGELLWLSDACDLGFLRVAVSDMEYDDLIGLREVNRDDTAFLGLKNGDSVFCAGSAETVGESMYEGTVADPRRYIEAFGAYMLYCFCDGRPGMSGGGTYDAFGNFVGMLTGGTQENETASVPVNVILEEYKKLPEEEQ